EEERPVFLDGPVEVEAVVIIAQLAFGLTSHIEKEIGGVQRVIAQEFKDGAVKLIAAAFGDEVDDGALRLAELGAEAVALDTKLLDRVYGREDQQRKV